MMFEAKIAGAEVKEEKQQGLKEYMQDLEMQRKQERAETGERVQFSEGLGYRVIGG